MGTECRSSFWMPDAHASAFEHEKPEAGMGSPAGSPYTVGISSPTKNPRNGSVEDSVSGTVVSNLRPQRRRGEPKARSSRPPVFIRSQEPAQRVPSIGVRRKRGCEKIHTPGHWSLVTGFPPSKALHSALNPYGLYTAFTPMIMSLFSFFSGSLVRLSFMSRVCSLPPFWKVPVHRASLSWYKVASTTSL